MRLNANPEARTASAEAGAGLRFDKRSACHLLVSPVVFFLRLSYAGRPQIEVPGQNASRRVEQSSIRGRNRIMVVRWEPARAGGPGLGG